MVLCTRGVQTGGDETLMPPLGRVESSEEVLTRIWTVSIGGIFPRFTTNTVLSKSSSIMMCPETSQRSMVFIWNIYYTAMSKQTVKTQKPVCDREMQKHFTHLFQTTEQLILDIFNRNFQHKFNSGEQQVLLSGNRPPNKNASNKYIHP